MPPIPPATGLEIPSDCGDILTVEAKLNYRKFNWWHTQWAYAGVRDPEDTDFQVGKGYDDGKWVWTGDTSDVAGKIKGIPNLPIIEMASAKTTLKVVGTHAGVPSTEVVDTEILLSKHENHSRKVE